MTSEERRAREMVRNSFPKDIHLGSLESPVGRNYVPINCDNIMGGLGGCDLPNNLYRKGNFDTIRVIKEYLRVLSRGRLD
ncbi:MAG: hypothetical protein WC494_00900 [Candidatus Pacearchaeota archaeon]